MNPVHLLVDDSHVQVSAPEGFSAGWSALAHTLSRVAVSLSRHTRFHHSLFGVDWTDYAISVPAGQLPGQLVDPRWNARAAGFPGGFIRGSAH